MSGPFVAEILDVSGKAFAGFAATRLLERYPSAESRFAPDAFTGWKTHFEQRLQELAAALAAEEPGLFLDSVEWSRRAFAAREVPEADLRASLECLREVLEDELPDEAGSQAGAVLASAIARFDSPCRDDRAGPDPATPTGKVALSYLLAVLEGDRHRAAKLLLDAVDDGSLTVEQAYLEVLIPAQQEVGRLWHTNALSVAEEHFVTSTTLHVMSLLVHRGGGQPFNGKTVIAAGVAGEVHDIGVRVAGDFFEMAGWRVIHVGADLPVNEVVDAARRFDADLIVLAATLSTHLRAVERTIAALRSEGGPKVIVGGQAFGGAPELWKKVGADAYAPSPGEAVEIAARMVGN